MLVPRAGVLVYLGGSHIGTCHVMSESEVDLAFVLCRSETSERRLSTEMVRIYRCSLTGINSANNDIEGFAKLAMTSIIFGALYAGVCAIEVSRIR